MNTYLLIQKHPSLPLYLRLLITSLVLVFSQQNYAFNKEEIEVFDLQYTDRYFLKSQRELANQIASSRIGNPFRQTQYDVTTLQRIIDRKLIRKDETKKLQALGVILGDLLAKDLKLNWKVYKDKVGRSRALCVRYTKHCLFPVTMISRRIEGGAPVNVQAVYDKAKAMIKPHLGYGSIYE